ncbi:MAG: peptidylprolyl isomerase [Rhodospirillales bacterium]|nr:peptidylprolyl isomerase [Rhodospirillales bacterium]
MAPAAWAAGPDAKPAPTAAAATPAAPAGAASADAAATPAPAAAGDAAAADPVVARVGNEVIHRSAVTAAIDTLPDNLRAMPPQVLYPSILEQLVDGRALVIQAKKTGLDKDPEVQQAVHDAAERALESAILSKEVAPMVTEAKVKAEYDKTIAGKPGPEEVHARHILVPTEAEAKSIIEQLNKGADFATLAKKYSKDPGGAQGGDLGFFKKDEMVAPFADAAFALKPGTYTKTPVHTQFGWHVIQVLGVRHAPPPSFAEAAPKLRQEMIQKAVQEVIAKARKGLKIETFNPDGSPIKATDGASPPKAQ